MRLRTVTPDPGELHGPTSDSTWALIQLHKVAEPSSFKSGNKLFELFLSLKEINQKLWVVEDDKRLCEKNSDFGEKFIKISRDVHFLNDKRAKIKLEINNLTGSEIKEVKQYTNY